MSDKIRIYSINGNEHAVIWKIGCGEYYHVHWEESNEDVVYSSENVDKAFEEGNWVAVGSDKVPNETTIAAMNETNIKRFATLEELFADLDAEDDILERIKSFTQSYDVDVMISGGEYVVYDNTWETVYKADSDEKLLEILDAIDFLASVVDV